MWKNYAKIWTLLKMHIWNVPRPPVFRFLNTPLIINRKCQITYEYRSGRVWVTEEESIRSNGQSDIHNDKLPSCHCHDVNIPYEPGVCSRKNAIRYGWYSLRTALSYSGRLMTRQPAFFFVYCRASWRCHVTPATKGRITTTINLAIKLTIKLKT